MSDNSEQSQPKIGWSNFALKNSTAQQGNSYSILTNDQVTELVLENWDKRQPGQGEKGLDRKVVVPIPSSFASGRFGHPSGTPFFRCTTALLHPDMPVKIRVVKRVGQEQEDFHVQKFITPEDGYPAEEAKFVKVVCYSAEALTENGGERSGPWEWEIVTIVASPTEKEPMTVGTMARNQLGLPGGTKSEYTGLEYAESAVYWGKRIKIVSLKKEELPTPIKFHGTTGNREICIRFFLTSKNDVQDGVSIHAPVRVRLHKELKALGIFKFQFTHP